MSQERQQDRPEQRLDEQGETAPESGGEQSSDAQRAEFADAQPEDPADSGPEAGAEAASESEELAGMREAMLRMRADMDNRERRLQRDMERSRKFAIESLLRDLVPALDSMDQALAVAGEQGEQQADEGLALTRRQLLGVLEKHGLQVLDPLGERFDPSWHEAMTTRPAGDQEPETVVQVLQKGYVLNERLVRPARVIVAK
ncbi:MAG: nucleotide exchange factor GrpE [Wenzhouxiangellaceae bacterium]